MEALGLIFAVKKAVVAADDVAKTFNDANGTLRNLRSQIDALDTIIVQIQNWLEEAGQLPKQQLSPSIDEVVSTIEKQVNQLSLELKRISASSGSSSGSTRTAEAQLRARLADIHEDKSLSSFALAVCNLPNEHHRLTCANELHIACSALRRARLSATSEERVAAITEETNRATDSSSNFRTFIAEISATERSRALDQDQDNTARKSSIGQGDAAVPSLPPRLNSGSDEMRSSSNGTPSTSSRPDVLHGSGHSRGPVHRQSTDSSSRVSIRSGDTPTAEEYSGPYASQPSHSSSAEAFSQIGTPNSPSNPISRKPLRSIIPPRASARESTIIPTSPTQEEETLPPEKTAFHNPTAAQTEAGPSNPRAPTTQLVARGSVSKMGPLAEDVPDEAPPAYQEQMREVPASITTTAQGSVLDDTSASYADEDGHPYLIKVVQDNLTPVLQVMIERGVDLNAVDADTQRTAIMESARLGRVDIAEMLLNAGCQLQWADAENNTALHYAITNGTPKLIQRIVTSDKVDVNSRGQNGQTGMHIAAENANPKAMSALIREGADPSLKNDAQQTPLHIAAQRGDVQLCDMLLEAGAETDTYDRDGKTPLELAALANRSALVELLLSRNDSVKGNDPELLRGFFEAVKVGNVRMAQSILAKGIKLKKLKESWKPAALAAQSGNLDMLRLVIDNKGSLKEKSPDGWTPLHFAASLGHTGIVQRLLDEKVSPKATTKTTNETALHLAILHGHASTADLLIAHKGTDLQAEDVDHTQPLHHAARMGFSSIAQALLAKGAKPNVENKYGWKPIHLAAAYGHTSLAADLIGNGANIEEKLGGSSYKPSKYTHEAIRRGYTAEARWPHAAGRPLAIALEFGQEGFARMLLAHGAKTDGFDVHGWRPLHQAAFACNPEMVETLLHRGMNPHATTNDNNTPLALGFRSSGLNATTAQKEQVRGLLKDAMGKIKPPRFDILRRGMSFGGNTASQRNLAWSSAETATALLTNRGSSSTALTEGETPPAPDAISTSGITPSSKTGDDSESMSLKSSSTDPPPHGSASPVQSISKRPSYPMKSPTESLSRDDAPFSPTPPPPPSKETKASAVRAVSGGGPQRSTDGGSSSSGVGADGAVSHRSGVFMPVELSASPSVHRGINELAGSEVVEADATPPSAPRRAPTAVAELPAEPF